MCKKKTIQQRLLSLSFLANPLLGNTLAAEVIRIVMTVAHQDPLRLRFNTVDGCATNGVANDIMKCIFKESCDLVCVSHTSNLPMKMFETATPIAHKFLQSWSQCLTQGSKVRAAVRAAIGEGGIRSHAIRWMAQYRETVQVLDKFAEVKNIILHENVGCESLMATLRSVLNKPAEGDQISGEDDLLLELALIKDSGEKIACFCNHFEGDGFLAPYAYDSWNEHNDHMHSVVERFKEKNQQSTVRDIAREISRGDVDYEQLLVQLTVAKAVAINEKLESDTFGRLNGTLQTLRGCRLAGYQFIKDTNIEALQEEVQFIQRLPLAVPIIRGLEAELPTYKRLADNYEIDDTDGWLFWRRYCTLLPLWYTIAAEVALVMCSSASVERVFSLLNCTFDSHQHQALNDYKEASIRIRYNENNRDRKQYE